MDQYTIEVLTLADGHRKIVARGGASARYVAAPGRPGHLIYVNKATMFAVPFDLAKLEVRGTPVPVLDNVAHSAPPGAGQFDFSGGPDGHGVLVYRRAGPDASAMLTLQWVDPAGKKEPLPLKPGAYEDPRVSPDGKRIAVTANEEGSTDIWVYDPQRDAMTRLTFGGGSYTPTWTPDGRYIVLWSVSKGIFQARADGASQPQPLLLESKGEQVPWSFTPDGKRLAYEDFGDGRWQIWTVPVEEQGGELKAGKPEQFLKSRFIDALPSFSPDGRWLVYHSSEAGKNEVYVRAFPPPSAGPGGKWQISNSGGVWPEWSRNGHDLFYQSGDQLMAVSYSVNGDTFVAGKPRLWIAKLGTTAGWDLAPDGKRVLTLAPVGSAEAPKPEHEVVFLENFFDYLRQRVPLGK